MTLRNFSSWFLFALAVGCSDPAPAPPDATVDAPDVPDAPGADGADVTFRCPALSYDAIFAQPCPGLDGVSCRYGYDVPECGGRTQSCRAGRWEEVHTDPGAACFDAGRDRPGD